MLFRVMVTFIVFFGGTAMACAAKVALVIGNGNYRNAVELPNPVNDAEAMTAKLEALGFDVTAGYDEDFSAMQATVNSFARKAVGADVALLFYAGHGMQVRGENYLVPVDAKFVDETSLDFEAIPVNFILRQMSRDVRLRIVFLDACRDNPLAKVLARSMAASRSVTVGDGLAEIKIQDAGEGTVIAFATSPGDVAYDGKSEHSPFTAALLKYIDAPDLPIQNVMTRVTRDVFDATKQAQRPWVNTSLIGDVYLNQSAAGQAAVAKQDTASSPSLSVSGGASSAPGDGPNGSAMAWDQEKTLFEYAQRGGSAEDYKAYLAAYPRGHFADIARNFLSRKPAGPAQGPDDGADKSQQLAMADQPAGGQTARTPFPNGAPGASTAAAPGAGTEMTEAMLGWGRDQRREVQARLKLEGNDLGTPDGNFGSRSRAAIMSWQSTRQFPMTGYFNQAQYEALVARTQQSYALWSLRDRERQEAAADAAAAARARAAQARRNAEVRRNNDRQVVDDRPVLIERRNNSSAGGEAFMGSMMGGIIGGAIGGAIGR